MAQWILKRSRNNKLIDLNLDKNELILLMAEQKTVGGMIAAIFKKYAQVRSKSRWGDKRPYYIRFIPELLDCFPDAKIIHIIRDGRDCVASLKSMPWWHHHPVYSMLNWRYIIRLGAKYKQQFKDQFMEIKYEDLVNEPEFIMNKICDYLGEKFYAGMLDYYQNSKQNVPAYKIGWHSKTHAPISKDSIGKWTSKLTEEEIKLMEWSAQDELLNWGYVKHKPFVPLLYLPQYIVFLMFFNVEIFIEKMIAFFNRIFYHYPLGY